MTRPFLPFNRPYLTGHEFEYMLQAATNAHLAGDGPFTQRCQAWLEQQIGCRRALLTHSCTAALEMAALLADIVPGDEVIMPSFTFVSTANAFVLRGAVPVFVDILPDTLNLDPALVDAAVTRRTRAIVPVHYAGVACEMESMLEIAGRSNLLVIEDAAQAIGSTYRGRPLGQFGHLAATSFHETKNIISGEGGALLINDEQFSARAEIIREKGTDRSRFLRGQTDKYSWVDIGSSFLPGELTAAFLSAQMECAASIASRRLEVWGWYYERCAYLETSGRVRRPIIPADCGHNAHMFYLLVSDPETRSRVLSGLNGQGINAVFHYVPLHSSAAGLTHARVSGSMQQTESLSERLIRLPLWIGLEQADCDRVATCLERLLH
jgi:dTDP-4-amino-4,6-dideoxygalactose transaminase